MRVKVIYYCGQTVNEFVYHYDWLIGERFRNLAIFRTLQIERHVNINVIKSAVSGTDKLIQSFAGVIGAINKTGFITGEPAGYDKNGRPYKDWKVADVGQAKDLLKRRKIRPLPPEAIENIKNRASKTLDELEKVC